MPIDPNRRPSSRTPRDWLRDIVERGDFIKSIVKDMDEQVFLQDRIRQDAICYSLLCLSEAVARLLYCDSTVVERYAEVPWHKIRGIGNVLRHGYNDLDLSVIWKAVTGNNLADLMRAAHKELDG
jgi:uncharacterized protein with HEPN domain